VIDINQVMKVSGISYAVYTKPGTDKIQSVHDFYEGKCTVIFNKLVHHLDKILFQKQYDDQF
jgi:hypothetical protein